MSTVGSAPPLPEVLKDMDDREKLLRTLISRRRSRNTPVELEIAGKRVRVSSVAPDPAKPGHRK